MRRKRITRGDVYGSFVELCKAAGKVNHDMVEPADRPLAGSWRLRYDPIGLSFGKGYFIEEPNDMGATFPMGPHRRPARQMVDAMSFSIMLLRSIRIDNLVQRQYEKIQEAIKALQPDLEDVGEWMFKRKRR